jgi:acid phosphatase family membrane protein YuiD
MTRRQPAAGGRHRVSAELALPEPVFKVSAIVALVVCRRATGRHHRRGVYAVMLDSVCTMLTVAVWRQQPVVGGR